MTLQHRFFFARPQFFRGYFFFSLLLAVQIQAAPAPASSVTKTNATPQILTPAAPLTPRINGPAVFGVRPNSPFFYAIPATGQRPLQFSGEGLPEGLQLDPQTGFITGRLTQAGEYRVTLHATNTLGADTKTFRVVVGDRIALTPPMGWSSWNCLGPKISQAKILRIARAMVASGLSQHGFVYVNLDDGWQGGRTGPGHALVGNTNFPDMKAMADEIHGMGLKLGIYSTPWETSYAQFPGGSAATADGKWKKLGHQFGAYSFAEADVREWSDWGVDYLKYDWNPIDIPHVQAMREALLAGGRDIVFSLSNQADYEHAADYARLAELWRTAGDIYDTWQNGDQDWHYGVSEIGFSMDRWAPFNGPGHWNDPDMLVVGELGWGGGHHPPHLTPDQQYTHISMWCLLSAPLVLGCDVEYMDAFTLGLLTNDEVLAIDQDELGAQAVRMGTDGPVDIYSKPLSDGSRALGFFNRGTQPTTVSIVKLNKWGVNGKIRARDLWRQQDLPEFGQKTKLTVPAGGVILLRVWKQE